MKQKGAISLSKLTVGNTPEGGNTPTDHSPIPTPTRGV